MINCLNQKKLHECLMLPQKPLLIGVMQDKLLQHEQKEDIEDSLHQKSYQNQILLVNDKCVMQESQQPPKKKIWKDKLNISDLTTQTMKLLKIQDQVLISNEKALHPFWTPQSKEISEKLWLPTEIDYVDLVMRSSKGSLRNVPMGQSWFSIKKKHPLKKNLQMTSFQLSQYSLPDSMVSGVIPSKRKSKKQSEKKTQPLLKTLKFRLFPTEEEKIKLQLQCDQYRWYYNATLNIVNQHFNIDTKIPTKKFSNLTVRQLFRQHEYKEEIINDKIVKEFIYNKDLNTQPIPPWWNNKQQKVHTRLPRGASDKFVSSLNACISNYKNKNISKFNMKYLSRKHPTDIIHYEDSNYPSFIKKIKSMYWFRNNNHSLRKRQSISLLDVDTPPRGIEIIYEKQTGKYFLHYPVEANWFPNEDVRNENQVKYVFSKGTRIISLDPGIRKFLVGYDPIGESIFIGEDANLKLMHLINLLDNNDDQYPIRKKIKNYINELHWKAISFLIENYDVIILPEFKVSQMLKSKKLSKITKRLMAMYSFFQFRQKLQFKCNLYNKKLIIVDESYTSCTCSRCGELNYMQGKEIYNCSSCNLKIDRDVAGSRNILIKNISVLTLGDRV
jgi:putative transposase